MGMDSAGPVLPSLSGGGVCCGAGRQSQDRSDCFLPLPVARCGNRPVFRLGWHLTFVHHCVVYWAVLWALLDTQITNQPEECLSQQMGRHFCERKLLHCPVWQLQNLLLFSLTMNTSGFLLYLPGTLCGRWAAQLCTVACSSPRPSPPEMRDRSQQLREAI